MHTVVMSLQGYLLWMDTMRRAHEQTALCEVGMRMCLLFFHPVFKTFICIYIQIFFDQQVDLLVLWLLNSCSYHIYHKSLVGPHHEPTTPKSVWKQTETHLFKQSRFSGLVHTRIWQFSNPSRRTTLTGKMQRGLFYLNQTGWGCRSIITVVSTEWTKFIWELNMIEVNAVARLNIQQNMSSFKHHSENNCRSYVRNKQSLNKLHSSFQVWWCWNYSQTSCTIEE